MISGKSAAPGKVLILAAVLYSGIALAGLGHGAENSQRCVQGLAFGDFLLFQLRERGYRALRGKGDSHCAVNHVIIEIGQIMGKFSYWLYQSPVGDLIDPESVQGRRIGPAPACNFPADRPHRIAQDMVHERWRDQYLIAANHGMGA